MNPDLDGRPLTGWRVLVPRGGFWGDDVAFTLQSHGALPVIAPMIDFAAAPEPVALNAALERLGSGEYDWLVVTSATTAAVLVEFAAVVPASTRVAAVGEMTSGALTRAGYCIDFVPVGESSARALVDEWPAAGPLKVLIPHSNLAKPLLAEGLMGRGLEVDAVPAYRTIGVKLNAEIVACAAAGHIRAILVTSGSVAREVQHQLSPLPPETIIACIGEHTARDAADAGIGVDVVAPAQTMDSLIKALAAFAAQGTKQHPEPERNHHS